MKRKPVRETTIFVWRSAGNELDRPLEAGYAKQLKQDREVGPFRLADGDRGVWKERWTKLCTGMTRTGFASSRCQNNSTARPGPPQCKQNQFQTIVQLSTISSAQDYLKNSYQLLISNITRHRLTQLGHTKICSRWASKIPQPCPHTPRLPASTVASSRFLQN